MLNPSQNSSYKWYVLALSALTNAVVVAVPAMAFSVLLPEISADLNLSLVQAGIVWGIGSLPLIVVGLLAGALGDRFGPRRVLAVSCLLVAISGGLRGLSADFPALALTSFLFGCLVPLITINNVKSTGSWFLPRELGLASGVISMGMALGFFLGAMLSATLISPWLGGWRNVFFLYAVISALFGLPWYLSKSAPRPQRPIGEKPEGRSFWEGMKTLVVIKRLWLLSMAVLGVSGSVQGLLGYLPLYLRGAGWSAPDADGALAAFHVVSMACVIPIAMWSDRNGSRTKFLIGSAVLNIAGLAMLSWPQVFSPWIAVVVAGMVRDAFMAIFLAMVIETKGFSPADSGIAIGFVMIFLGIGNLLAPPLGNSLASIAPGAPFLFWAALAAFGLACIALIRDPKPALGRNALVKPAEDHPGAG